jgi:tetratricopeptide (TPR) repeat protein
MLLLAGLLLGLASLVRDNLILLAPLLALWLIVDLRVRPRLDAGRLQEAAVRVGCFTAGVLIAVLPVTARNGFVSGDWVLLTSGGGEVFYIGNNSQADGTYAPPAFVRASSGVEHEDFRREAARRLGHAVTRREASDYWLGEGIRWITAHPLDYAILLGRKVLVFLNGYEQPDNQSFDHHRIFVPLLARLPTWTALLPLAAAGAVLSLPAWRDLLPLYLIGGGYAATVMLFFNFGRFRMPLVPILLVLAGEAIVEIPAILVRRRSLARAGPALAAAAAAGLAALLPIGNDALHRGQSDAELAALMAQAGRWDEAAALSRSGIDLLESVYTGAGGHLAAGGHGVAPPGDRSRPELSPSYYDVLSDAYVTAARVANARKEAAARLDWLSIATAAAPDAESGFDALVEYGEALLDGGRAGEALAPLLRARSVDPNDLRLALLYAQALHRSGRLHEAIDAVEKALDANPGVGPLDLADANYGLGLIYRDLGDLPRMKFHLRETLKENPNHPRAAWIREVVEKADSTESR